MSATTVATPLEDPRLLLEHYSYVRGLARQLVFDEHLAQDVEQQTWLAALEHAPRDPRSPRAWLATLVRNFAMRAWRGRERRQRSELAAARVDTSITTPAEILERESVRRSLVDAVLALDDPCRSVLILRYFDELPPREIARRTGVPVETVRTRIKRGLELLRARMQHEHGREHAVWALPLVRAMRLEPASSRAVATAAAKSLIPGVVLMSIAQKTTLGAAAIALIAASLFVWDRSDAAEPQAAGIASAEAREPAAPGSDVRATDASAAPERSEVATPPPVVEPAAAASEARYGSLLLRVVWGDDKSPAADVGLKLYQSAADDFHRDTLLARTGDDGSVLVDPILAGNISIFFDRGGQSDARVERGQRAEATIEIPIGFDLEGYVRDADARTVAGAEIYVYQLFGDPYEGNVVARSHDDGSYFVRSLDAGLNFVSARAPGRAPSKQRLVMSVAKAKVKLDLVFDADGGMLEGVVLAPDGSPCAGAAVVVGKENAHESIKLDDGTEGRNPAPQRVFADDAGRFRFAGVAEGTQTLQARAKGFAPWKSEVDVVARRTTSVDVELSLGARLEGVIRDDSGAPAARAEVTADGGYGFRSLLRRARDDGSFTFEDLPLGEFEVAVDGGEKGSAKATLLGASGANLRWDPVLARGLVLRGHVEAPGRALAGWWMQIDARGAQEPFLQMAQTDAQGRFEVVGCPDLPLYLEVHAPEGGNWAIAIVENVRASAGELVIRPDPALEPSVRIHGRVVDALGHPLAGARIIPSRTGFNTAPILASEIETGAFDLGPYPPGAWCVRVKAIGFADFVTERRTLAPGEIWNLGELAMQRGGQVVVDVRRDVGLAASKPHFVLKNDEGRDERLQLEGDVARSAAVAPGRYRLFVSGGDVALAARVLEVREGEETRCEVRLQRGVAVTLRFVDAAERTFEGDVDLEVVDARASTLAMASCSSTWSGRLLPGTYRFVARDGAGHTGALDVVVDEGATDEVAERTLRIR